MEERNALISSVNIANEFGLTVWMSLIYGNGISQEFGGYTLYSAKNWQKAELDYGNYCGRFIKRCMEIGEVENFSDLKGKSIRVRCDGSCIKEIGHIIKDDWFNPSKDFKDYKIRVANLF